MSRSIFGFLFVAVGCIAPITENGSGAGGSGANGGADSGGATNGVGGSAGTKPNGSACDAGGECESAFCVEGVCCDDACTGECESCSVTEKSGGTEGLCEPIPDSTSCGTATCADGIKTFYTCQAGSCNPSEEVCKAGCTGDLCAGDCPATPCEAAEFCDPAGHCIAKLPNGTACIDGAECQSGQCADGVCCESACTGTCQACVQSLTGQASGSCRNVQNGVPQPTDCPTDGASTCDRNGTCNGAGACAYYPVGTACSDGSCASGEETSPGTCDGLGACATTTSSCGLYVCGGDECRTSCINDNHCADGYECSGGLCGNPGVTTGSTLPNGSTCVDGTECSSGFCVDDRCCETACDGECSVCNSSGTCVAVPNGTDPDGDCPDNGATCGETGVCAGGACQITPAGVQCAPPSCSGATLTGARVCDGSGTCPQAFADLCPGNLRCLDSTQCRTVCSEDGHCNPGHFCSGGDCVEQLPNGTACGGSNQCFDGSCTDGVCCDSPCIGSCVRCDQPGSLGTCVSQCGGQCGACK